METIFKKRLRESRQLKALVATLRKAGKTMQQIGDELGVTKQRVSQILKELERE